MLNEDPINLIVLSQVFPFAILLDPQMRIYHMGHSIKNIFPPDTALIGRYLDDAFRLVRPDILVEWNRVRPELLTRCSRTNDFRCL